MGLEAIPSGLVARWLGVVFQIRLFNLVRASTARTVTILTWGSLRGGVSVALARCVPRSLSRDALVTITYALVVFSILVQRLTTNGVLGDPIGT